MKQEKRDPMLPFVRVVILSLILVLMSIWVFKNYFKSENSKINSSEIVTLKKLHFYDHPDGSIRITEVDGSLITFIKGEAFNIGGNYSCTVGNMLKTLISFSTVKKFKIVIDKKRLRPIDADLQIPDTSKFKKISGWKPSINFKKTMLDLLNYWRQRVSNDKDIIIR